jgi:hypothetical protein
MTIGRSAANSIKIKTDGEAGLRAVSCGCCCPGCTTFRAITEATSIVITHSRPRWYTTSKSFSTIAPTKTENVSLASGPYGEGPYYFTTFTCDPTICSVTSMQSFSSESGYTFTSSVSVQFSVVDGECVAVITTSAYEYLVFDQLSVEPPPPYVSIQLNGSIQVPLSQLFGTHQIPETGWIGEFSTGDTLPTSATSTVIIG